MRRVVSVSLGSSHRDHTARLTLLGEEFELQRVGADGDAAKAAAIIRELDGQVDCIGLGGMDRYLVAGSRRWEIRQVGRLARQATRTPVVDGGGYKRYIEPYLFRQLHEQGIVNFTGKRVLLCAAVDRFGVAPLLPELGAEVCYGDLVFALGLPIGIRRYGTIRLLARLLLPGLAWLPMSALYPTGEKQREADSRFAHFYQWAEIIAGDFHFVRRHLPQDIKGKVVITNTTTAKDVDTFRERGAAMMVTTTPEVQGRSFATNVNEGVLVTLAGKHPDEMTGEDYLNVYCALGWGARVVDFT